MTTTQQTKEALAQLKERGWDVSDFGEGLFPDHFEATKRLTDGTLACCAACDLGDLDVETFTSEPHATGKFDWLAFYGEERALAFASTGDRSGFAFHVGGSEDADVREALEAALAF